MTGVVKLLRDHIDIQNIDLRVSKGGNNVRMREILIHFIDRLVIRDDPEVQIFRIARVLRDASHARGHRVQPVAKQADVNFLRIIVRTEALNMIASVGLRLALTSIAFAMCGVLVVICYLVFVTIVSVELLCRDRSYEREEQLHSRNKYR